MVEPFERAIDIERNDVYKEFVEVQNKKTEEDGHRILPSREGGMSIGTLICI
jgi:hypothetical protein